MQMIIFKVVSKLIYNIEIKVSNFSLIPFGTRYICEICVSLIAVDLTSILTRKKIFLSNLYKSNFCAASVDNT